MRSHLPFIVALLGLLAPTLTCAGARADVASELKAIDARMSTCMDKDQSNMGMKQCTGDADTAADAILNRVYKAITTKLKTGEESDKEIMRRLIASERAWIAYRDADCSLQGTMMLGGTGEGLEIVTCYYRMTGQRARSLEDFLKGR